MSLLADKSHFMIRVSSVLNKDVKSFGKQFLTDRDTSTCWNSDRVRHIHHARRPFNKIGNDRDPRNGFQWTLKRELLFPGALR